MRGHDANVTTAKAEGAELWYGGVTLRSRGFEMTVRRRGREDFFKD